MYYIYMICIYIYIRWIRWYVLVFLDLMLQPRWNLRGGSTPLCHGSRFIGVLGGRRQTSGGFQSMSSGCAAQNGSAESWMTLELEKQLCKHVAKNCSNKWDGSHSTLPTFLGSGAYALRMSQPWGPSIMSQQRLCTIRTINNIPTKTLYHEDHRWIPNKDFVP